MRTLKKTMCLVLALVMMLGLCAVSASATSFTDDASISATYAEAAEVLNGIGVFKGYTDGSFQPKAEITRGEVAAILYRVVTGDVTDRQIGLYKDYNKFTDVPSTTWYAGYINFVANAQLVKGHGDDTFGGDEHVTGYQVLAMFLRAIGYGKAGEFEGAGWQIETASQAKKLGLTNKIDTTTLGSNATREEVAEMIFQAIQVPQVTYSQLGGYSEYNSALGFVTGAEKNDSLGKARFGLSYTYGVVMGNQATGEKYTKIQGSGEDPTTVPTTYGAAYYTYGGSSFDIETDLDWFGHAVKVWYDKNGGNALRTYAMFDEAAMVDVVVAKAGNNLGDTSTSGYLGKVAKDAGFKIASSGAYGSNAYAAMNGSIGTTPASSAAGIYALISNSSDKTLDVVIAVDAVVAQISQVNTTAKDQTLTLASSGYGAGSDGVIFRDSVLAGSATALGSEVIAQKITGTNSDKIGTNKAGDLPYYDLQSLPQSISGKVSAYNAATGEVTLSDGSKLEQSPLYGVVKSGITQTTPNTNASYTFTLDKSGKYLGAKLSSDATFIYGTYADFQDPNLGESTISYYMFGVDMNGSKLPATQIKKIDTNDINGARYNALAVTRKTYGLNGADGNTITKGAYTGYAVGADGSLSTTLPSGINKLTSDWTLTSDHAKAGYYSIGGTLFLTNSTKFVVVSGTGTDTLDVKTYNGIGALLGSANQVVIDWDSTEGSTYYTQSSYIYNNAVGSTWQVDTVILPAKAMTTTTNANLFYCAKATAGVTDTKTSAVAYELYNTKGEKATYYLTSAPSDNTFYTLTETTSTTNNGEKTYAIASVGDGSTAGTLTVKVNKAYGGTGNTNNLDTALLDSVLYTVTNAAVVDVTGGKDSGGKDINAMDSLAALNAAVSGGGYSSVEIDFAYTTGSTPLEAVVIFVRSLTV